MIRYRPEIWAPGMNRAWPPGSDEELLIPRAKEGEEWIPRAEDGEAGVVPAGRPASWVGTSEEGDQGIPQEGQNRLPWGTSEEQPGQERLNSGTLSVK
jgi:hypothetical protein